MLQYRLAKGIDPNTKAQVPDASGALERGYLLPFIHKDFFLKKKILTSIFYQTQKTIPDEVEI